MKTVELTDSEVNMLATIREITDCNWNEFLSLHGERTFGETDDMIEVEYDALMYKLGDN